MKERFLVFVGKSSAAWIIAIIPVINFVYLILLFIYTPVEKLIKYVIGGALAASAIFTLGKWIFPEKYMIIVPYIVMLVLSYLSLILVRPMILESRSMHNYAKMRALTICIVFILILLALIIILVNQGQSGSIINQEINQGTVL